MIDSPVSPRRSVAGTAYDTGWLAAIPHRDDRRDPKFPGALNWITTHQHPDGSWGSAIRYEPDRIICTLAALIPLAWFGRRHSDRTQIRAGERYLWQHAHLLKREPCDLVGFELLLPTLINLASVVSSQVTAYLCLSRARSSSSSGWLITTS